MRQKYKSSVLNILSWILLEMLMACASNPQGDPLRITSPTPGTIVNSGSSFVVTVVADALVTNVAVVAGDPLGWGEPSATPGKYVVRVPVNTSSRPYFITVVGSLKGKLVKSEPTQVLVEKPEDPTELTTEPQHLEFDSVGGQSSLSVLGNFSDGSTVDVTESTRTKYIFNNPFVATVDKRGHVTANGSGTTFLLVAAKRIIPRTPKERLMACLPGAECDADFFFPVDVVVKQPNLHPDSRLRITSPVSGTTVSPGDSVKFFVEADPGVFEVQVLGQEPLAQGAGSMEFSIVIPEKTPNGEYHVCAVGSAEAKSVTSNSVKLIVKGPQASGR